MKNEQKSERLVTVSVMGLVICNVGIALPWGSIDQSVWFGAEWYEWIINFTFFALAWLLVYGVIRDERAMRLAIQGSGGMWAATGIYLLLSGRGFLYSIALMLICFGMAAICFGMDWISIREEHRASRAS